MQIQPSSFNSPEKKLKKIKNKIKKKDLKKCILFPLDVSDRTRTCERKRISVQD